MSQWLSLHRAGKDDARNHNCGDVTTHQPYVPVLTKIYWNITVLRTVDLLLFSNLFAIRSVADETFW